MSRKIIVRKSTVHGRGVFAKTNLQKDELVIEYRGEIIDWEKAQSRHPHDPQQPYHTFFFSLDDDYVIDGNVNGNNSRWINHACSPNCEAQESTNRLGRKKILIVALRDIIAGEELFYDYRLEYDGRKTKRIKNAFACHCGMSNCRGTLLL